ncbi:Ferric-chelate reductase, partial [Aspergillus sp. HF37]
DYFIAAGAVYMACLLTAQGIIYLRNGLHTATFDLLPCGLIRVRIPTVITWKPGQHVFARFIPLGLHSLTAHPFTISSIARDPDKMRMGNEMGNEIAFYIKPKRSITARMARVAAKSPGSSTGVFLEGPYGGLSTDLARFDAVVVIVGGSGGGFSLGVVEEALRVAQRTVEIVYATRDTMTAKWYEDEIDALVAKYDRSTDDVSKSIHITSPAVQSSEDTQVPDLEKVAQPDASVQEAQRQLRPNIAEIIASATNGDKGKRVGIFACGPSSMLNDTRNAAAQAQRGVLSNEIKEAYLHTEPFGW